MYTSSASVFSVNHPARSICAQKGSKERHRFLVGTCALHEENLLSVLEYHEDSNSIEAPAVYSHSGQISSIEPSPQDSSLAVTTWQELNGSNGATLWRMPHQRENEIEETEPGAYIGEHLQLEKISDLNSGDVEDGLTHSVKWHSMKDSLLLSKHSEISCWSIDEADVKLSSKMKMGEKRSLTSNPVLAWDPHAPSSCAVGYGSALSFVDVRKMEISSSVQEAHSGNIRDLDYNPNKPLTLVTAGDDRKVKFWDARNLKKPIKTLIGHSHWVWSVRYNPFHDQLLLSGGTDNLVVLWRVASCSSAPWLGADDMDGDPAGDSSDPPDIKVRAIDQHEESVHAVAWSPSDAWVYCSLSFDGRVILNHVPSTEKYKILL